MPAAPNDMDVQTFGIIGGDSTVSSLYQYRAGLTKREYLAGLAMEGVLSDSHLMQLIREASEEETHTPKFVAGLAVEYAGALLTELAK